MYLLPPVFLLFCSAFSQSNAGVVLKSQNLQFHNLHNPQNADKKEYKFCSEVIDECIFLSELEYKTAQNEYQAHYTNYLKKINKNNINPVPQTYSNWMGDLLQIPKYNNFTLFDIILPGTHDSGASFLDPASRVVNQGKWVTAAYDVAKFLHLPIGQVILPWSLAQDLSLYDQLLSGIRYLDIRAGFDGVDWKIHHGLTGILMKDAFNEIAQFLEDFPNEIVILEVQPTIIGKQDPEPYYPALQKIIENSKLAPHRLAYHNKDKSFTQLSKITMKEIINRGTRAVVCYPPHFQDRFFPMDTILNSFANSNVLITMEKYNDVQINAFNSEKEILRKENRFFKLSWTLTPNGKAIIQSLLPGYTKSLRELAMSADKVFPHFAHEVQEEEKKFPSIIIADFVENAHSIDLIIQYNKK